MAASDAHVDHFATLHLIQPMIESNLFGNSMGGRRVLAFCLGRLKLEVPMGNYDWILDVLTDIEDYARTNDCLQIADEVRRTKNTAHKELSVLKSASASPVVEPDCVSAPINQARQFDESTFTNIVTLHHASNGREPH